MSINPQEFARLLGAEIVGKVPDVGGGPFGMARLARVMLRTIQSRDCEGAGKTQEPPPSEPEA